LATQVKDSTEHTSDVTICSLDTATLATSATHTMITSALRPSQIFGNNLPWYPVKTSHCQNVPQSKRPILKTSRVKTSPFWSKTSPSVKTSQVKTYRC